MPRELPCVFPCSSHLLPSKELSRAAAVYYSVLSTQIAQISAIWARNQTLVSAAVPTSTGAGTGTHLLSDRSPEAATGVDDVFSRSFRRLWSVVGSTAAGCLLPVHVCGLLSGAASAGATNNSPPAVDLKRCQYTLLIGRSPCCPCSPDIALGCEGDPNPVCFSWVSDSFSPRK